MKWELWWFPLKMRDKGDVCCLPYSDFILISMIQLSSWLGVVANECLWRLANPKDPPIHLILGLSLCTFSMVAWTRQVMWSPFLWFCRAVNYCLFDPVVAELSLIGWPTLLSAWLLVLENTHRTKENVKFKFIRGVIQDLTHARRERSQDQSGLDKKNVKI